MWQVKYFESAGEAFGQAALHEKWSRPEKEHLQGAAIPGILIP